MTFHESDADLEIELTKSLERQYALDIKSREERKYQQSINSLKMVEKPETKEIQVNGNTQTVNVINFYIPKNYAGNDMDPEYRDAQKLALIANNTARLGE